MLSTRMTLDDEEAVQRELAQLQAEAVPPIEEPLLVLPNAPAEDPVSQGPLCLCCDIVRTHTRLQKTMNTSVRPNEKNGQESRSRPDSIRMEVCVFSFIYHQ